MTTSDQLSPTAAPPRWLHWLALLTVCAALPLVVLGAEVTTKQVGMVDSQGVRSPLHLVTMPREELHGRGVGYLIEHSHRTAGWLVGVLAIGLAVGTAVGFRHPKARWLGCLALLMVSLQGLLGIFRVQFNVLLGPPLALVHGLFAQLVLATLIAVAVMTARSWWRGEPATGDVRGPRRLALVLMLLTFTQIIFGGMLRHLQDRTAQRLHFLFAFAVVVHVPLVLRAARDAGAGKGVRRATWLLTGLVFVQVALGIEAWLRRFGAGVPVELLRPNRVSDWVRSAHFVVGAALFMNTVVLNLLLYRPSAAAAPEAMTETPGDAPARRPLTERVPAGVGGAV